MRTVIFKVSASNELGFFNLERKAKTEAISNDFETIFKDALNSLPKRISNTWESISFVEDNKEVEVQKHWLVETDWDFNESHTIQDLNL